MLGTAANSRDESRGGHFRIDEPEQKDEFEAVNQGKLLVETIKSSDTCRESFKSFKSKLE